MQLRAVVSVLSDERSRTVTSSEAGAVGLGLMGIGLTASNLVSLVSIPFQFIALPPEFAGQRVAVIAGSLLPVLLGLAIGIGLVLARQRLARSLFPSEEGSQPNSTRFSDVVNVAFGLLGTYFVVHGGSTLAGQVLSETRSTLAGHAMGDASVWSLRNLAHNVMNNPFALGGLAEVVLGALVVVGHRTVVRVVSKVRGIEGARA